MKIKLDEEFISSLLKFAKCLEKWDFQEDIWLNGPITIPMKAPEAVKYYAKQHGIITTAKGICFLIRSKKDIPIIFEQYNNLHNDIMMMLQSNSDPIR